jgi:hypothetical protein
MRGFASDEAGNIYACGIAEICPPFCTEAVLIKFNASFELEWVYYFPDSVGIRDESFAFSEIGNPVVFTKSQTRHEIWEFNNDGILQNLIITIQVFII